MDSCRFYLKSEEQPFIKILMTGSILYSKATKQTRGLKIEQVYSFTFAPTAIDSEPENIQTQDSRMKNSGINQTKEKPQRKINEEGENTHNKKYPTYEISRTKHQDFLDHMQFITGYDIIYIKDYADDDEIIQEIIHKNSVSNKESSKMTNYSHLELTLKIFFHSAVDTIRDTINSKYGQFDKLFGQMTDDADFDKKQHIKLDEKNIMNNISILFTSYLKYMEECRKIDFQAVTKVLVLLIFFKKDLSLTDKNIEFQSDDDRRSFLFIELVAFSDIFFWCKKINKALFSKYEGQNMIKEMFDLHGNSNQVSLSFDSKNKRLFAESSIKGVPLDYQSMHIRVPINYFEASVDNKEQVVTLDDCEVTFRCEKKKGGISSGLIIDCFSEDTLANRLFCKELLCQSSQYNEKFQERFDYYKSAMMKNRRQITEEEYSELASRYDMIPPFDEYSNLRNEHLASQYTNFFNSHVELFGYYLMRYLDMCPDFTVFRSEFDSKTFIVMNSLTDEFQFVNDIDPRSLLKANVGDFVQSAIILHKLRTIHSIFSFADFHRLNVALDIENNAVKDMNIIDLWPAVYIINIDAISEYKFLNDMMEGNRYANVSEETRIIDLVYNHLEKLPVQERTGDFVVDDIMTTKECRFRMLTYHTFVSIFRKLILKVREMNIKIDPKVSICCFAARTLFEAASEEMTDKKLISGDFEHKKDYIDFVTARIGTYIYRFTTYICDNILREDFSLFRSHIFKHEWIDQSQNQSKMNYICTNWANFINNKMKPHEILIICYAVNFDLKEMEEISALRQSVDPKVFHIWLEDPAAFDICKLYIKYKYGGKIEAYSFVV